MIAVMDIESDGLLDKITKIHCLCYTNIETMEEVNLTNYSDIRNFLAQENLTLICHNIIRYDKPALEKILQITVNCKLIDTLGLSWYLYPERDKHGLEYWGEDFGIPKPKIADWNNLSVEEYIHRCREDVKINTTLYLKQKDYFNELYDNDVTQIQRIIGYLMFKLDCAREQEEVRWKLDVEYCKRSLEMLYEKEKVKTIELQKAMPDHVLYKNIIKPNKCYKKDNSLSEAGKKWFALLADNDLQEDFDGVIKVENKREPGNLKSTPQKKAWLFSLGWQPCTFKFDKEEDGSIRKIPQIYNENGVVDSIKLLYEKEPSLESLDGLSIINHRISILKGFLKNVDEEGYIKAEIKGFTNTLRFQHTTVVNLPTIHKVYGTEVRGCLICEDDELLCGSDMSGLESNTQDHYITYYDKKYVEEKRVPGFDPHIDLGKAAGLITEDEEKFFNWFKSKK